MHVKYEVEVLLPVAVYRGRYTEGELAGGARDIIERALGEQLGLPKGGKLELRFEWERDATARGYRMWGYLRERERQEEVEFLSLVREGELP